MIFEEKRISWQHEDDSPIRTAICMIFDKEDKFLASAGAHCSQKDQYSKEAGRRISFQRALMIASIKLYPESKFDQKQFRTRAWEAYRTMTKEPRWEITKQEAHAG